MGDDEGIGGGERPSPNADIGEELRRFFIELLKDGNLQRYRSIGRNAYIDERIRPDDWTPDRDDYFDKLGPDALRLLKSADLLEIEAHVAEVTGSGQAHLLYTVCPPM
jgi:hypothetical protein